MSGSGSGSWQSRHVHPRGYSSGEAARDWLLRNETDVAEIERVTGEVVEAERGPGQPRIGTPIKVTLPDEQVAMLDGWVADGRASSRSDAVRQAVTRGLATA